MSSPNDLADGTPTGRAGSAGSPALRRTSSAFGSPGADSTVKRLDLNDAFIKHPDATFLVRAAGNDMQGAGIGDDDVLIVDRALTAKHGSIVIAVVSGELICRRLEQLAARGKASAVSLVAANPAVAPIAITSDTPLEVWGVVCNVVKSLL